MAESSKNAGVEYQEDTNGKKFDRGEEEEELSVLRGGPLYVHNLMSPITSVPFFQSSILQQLQDLEVEVSSVSSQVSDEDISVDELKIISEEELVDMAIKEVLKDDEKAPNDGIADDLETSDDRTCKKKPRKRKERETNALEDTYRDKKVFWSHIAKKVEDIKKIKEKQDEDKAAVTLHSYNPSLKIEGRRAVTSSSRTIERLKPLRSASSAVKVKSCSNSSIQDYIPVQHPEVALTVEVYHNVKIWIKTQEFLVLGRQSLTELRDKIYCLTDHVMRKDPSGYFLIEDTFYNDLRDPSALDYSEPILDWLTNSRDNALQKWESILGGANMQKQKKLAVVDGIKGSQLPHYRVIDMHKTKFRDLKFRLGAGYLYCHQGDCRHTIVIRDMRLLHPEDVQNSAVYPILLFQLKLHVRKCNVCRIYRATKVTVDDKYAPENPCYFCEQCYYLLHYKGDGSLHYQDFEVYDYQHDQPR
ncbi:putative snRNA-activating protein complex, subunit 3 [Rosa chinensis]|uniref:Putative snRNA-activating protein complex, subunit 3 n=1 Tax=Rosa chinensis TaxID=74649 RepID=A0A2P6PFC1_ROSCH|nr:snRNA-activating protein complex subunit [Rosa chinensis]PRQ20626.1 putative snRNA-activating protein complex, subunit 3 [Rosa chinensis]